MSNLQKISDYEINEIYNNITNKENFINNNLDEIMSNDPIIYSQLSFFDKKYNNSQDSIFLGTLIYKTLKTKNTFQIEKDSIKNLISEISKKNSDYLENILKRINKENSEIGQLIKKVTHESEYPETTKFSGIIIYRLFEIESLKKLTQINSNKNKYPQTYKFRNELNHSILAEDYEKAAKLRDKINKTNEKL